MFSAMKNSDSISNHKYFFGLATMALALAVLVPTVAQAQGESVYAVDARNNQLRTMNPVTGETVATVAMTSADGTVNGANGLAKDPTTGTLWAMLKIGGGVFIGRVLVTLDPATGVATTIGDTGMAFAGIAFDSAGGLYGITGDGAGGADEPLPSPDTLYTLSKADGTPTLVVVLGNGDDGETIAFNPNDGLIYHLSGIETGVQVFETIDPAGPAAAPINIPLSGVTYSEAVSLVHWFGDLFLMSDFGEIGVGDGRFYVLSTRGEVRALNAPATLGLTTKGMVFTGTPLACPAAADLYGAAHKGPDGLSILYAINPADGTPTAVGPVGFERVGAMAFDGAGTLFGVGETMDGASTSTFITIDPCTGAGTAIGPTGIGGIPSETVTDTSFRNADGVLYAYLLETGRLGIVNTVTGEVTLVGNTGLNCCGNGIAFDAADT